MDVQQLTAVVAKHGNWLVDRRTGKLANLRWANLSRADLRWANLRLATLSGADLSGADLNWANLSGANLSGADLSEADLSEADLSESDLSEANLSEADLSEANLSEANLSEANLSGAVGLPETPIVPAPHRATLAALAAGGTINRRSWHVCDTTHCRAGWIVYLAGKPGRKLEVRLGTNAAAALIVTASCPQLAGRVPD